MSDWLDQWDPGPTYSEPDKFEQEPGYYQAVWYSPHEEGEDPLQASEVELSREGFIYREYTHISEWYMDEPYIAEEHGDFWNTQTIEMDPEDVRAYFHQAIVDNPKLQMPRDPMMTARWFAKLGGAYISYYGGEEDEAETLP